jgi:hypothetical protein
MTPPIAEGLRFTTPQGYPYVVTAIGRGRFLASNAGEEYIFPLADWGAGKYTHDTAHVMLEGRSIVTADNAEAVADALMDRVDAYIKSGDPSSDKEVAPDGDE